jgi:hypothetical protein
VFSDAQHQVLPFMRRIAAVLLDLELDLRHRLGQLAQCLTQDTMKSRTE